MEQNAFTPSVDKAYALSQFYDIDFETLCVKAGFTVKKEYHAKK